MKTIIISALAGFTLAGSLFAVDTTMSTDKSIDIKLDKSLTSKKSSDKKSGTVDKNSRTQQKSLSSDLIIDTYPIYLTKSRDCSNGRKTLTDFGLNFEDKENGYNVTKKNFIDSLAQASGNIEKANINVSDFKIFISCLAEEGAKFAQANINLNTKLNDIKNVNKAQLEKYTFSSFDNAKTITDNVISKILKKSIKEINDNDCNFFHTLTSVQCGDIYYDFQKNELYTSNSLLYSGGSSYGINSSLKISVSDSKSKSYEKSNENSTTSSSGTTMSKNKTTTKSQKQQQQLSTSKVTPVP